jgi:hypothetical protein
MTRSPWRWRHLPLVVLASLLLGLGANGALAAGPRQTGTDFCKTPELSNSGRIEAGKTTTLTAAQSPFHVDCSVTVDTGGVLAIEPGVRLDFGTGRRVDVKGTLTLSGAAPGDIVFSSDKESKAAGDWDGVSLRAGATATLNGFTFEYGGKSSPALTIEQPGLAINNAKITKSDLIGVRISAVGATLQGVEISDHRQAGLQVTDKQETITNVSLTNVTFERNLMAVESRANVQFALSGNSARENGTNGIATQGTLQGGAVTFRGGDLPYVLPGAIYITGPTLTLEPDTIVKMTASGSITNNTGRLEVAGTAEAKVYLTAFTDDQACLTRNAERISCDTNNDGSASTPSPGGGNWGRITLNKTGLGANILHAVVRYGSESVITVLGRDVVIANTTVSNSAGTGIRVSQVPVTITDSRLVQNRGSQNQGRGIDLETQDPVVATIRNNTFEQNGGAALRRTANFGLITSGNTTPGFTNGVNGYQVDEGTVRSSQRWLAGDLPYVLNGTLNLDMTDAEQTLTIEPGLTIKLGDNDGLTLNRGKLKSGAAGALSTLFTSILHDKCADGSDCDTNGDGSATSPIRGAWAGVVIERTSSGVDMPNTRLLYGGGRSVGAAIYVKHASPITEPAVADTEVAESLTAGIRVDSVNQSQLANNYLHDNEGPGIQLGSTNTDPKIRLVGNRIENNGGAAIDMDANVEVLPEGNPFPTGNLWNGIMVRGQARVTRTWYASNLAYVIPDKVQVDFAEKRLILEPGTVVKFDSNGYIAVSKGSLQADGTAEKKIYFTSVHDDSVGGNTDGKDLQPTGWGYILFDDGGQGGVIRNAELRRAGTASTAAIRVESPQVVVQNTLIEDGLGTGITLAYPGTDASGKQPEILDNTIRRQIGYGIEVVSGARPLEPKVQRNTISRTNQAAIIIDANTQLDHSGNTATECLINGIMVQRSTMNTTRRWTAGDLVYVVDQTLTIGTGELRIDPGVVVKFTTDGKLSVDRGRLVVPYTVGLSPEAAKTPIWFTALLDDTCGTVKTGCDTGNDGSAVPFAGYWSSLDISVSASVSNIRNAVITYAGAAGAQGAMVVRKGMTIEDSVFANSFTNGLFVSGAKDMVITNSTFQDNLGVGLVFEGDASARAGDGVSGNRFIGNARSMRHRATGAVPTANNVALGNDEDAMDYCANVNTSQSWQNDLARDISCSVSVGAGAALTVEPGTVLRIGKGNSFRVSGGNSRLDITGALLTLLSGTDAESWGGIKYEKDAAGFVRYSTLVQGGTTSGAMVDVQSVTPFDVTYNTFLRSFGSALYVHNNLPLGEVDVLGNIIRRIEGRDGIGVKIEQGGASIRNNRIADAGYGVRLNASGSKTEVTGNNMSELALFGVENRDRTKCIEAQGNWWGDASGPYDPIRDGPPPCEGEYINEKGTGVPVSNWVNYKNWLTVKPPAAPTVDMPMCGTTSQHAQQVSGATTPGATVNIYDGTSAQPDQPIATTTAGANGRFSTTVNLTDGHHELSFAATAAGATVSARSAFRVLEVRSSQPIDPAGIRFEYGPVAPDTLPRAQPLRDEAGCAIACGGLSAGRVTLPGGMPVKLFVPGSAGVTGLSFKQGSTVTPLTAGAGGVWTTAPFLPTDGQFSIDVQGTGATACNGYADVGGKTGFVFLDSGAVSPGNPALQAPIRFNNFEVPDPAWTADPPNSWQVIDTTSHSPTHSITDSPGGNYAPKTTVIFNVPVVDLTTTVAPQLSFWHKFQLAKGDRMRVQFKVTANGSWDTLKGGEWYEQSSLDWQQRVMPLDDYAKIRTFWLRFQLVADSDANVADGWYLDDISIGPGGALNGRFDAGSGYLSELHEPVLPEASVRLLQRNMDTGLWASWDGQPTNQPNPQTTDDQGRYGFYYLPAGEYRLQVTPKPGSGLGPVTTRPVIVWNGALNQNVALAGSTPLHLPIVMRGAVLGNH